MVVFGRTRQMTRDSLAVAIEALSWMDYEGIGERTALFRAAKQIDVQEPRDLRQAFRIIMETSRFRNRLDSVVKGAAGTGSFEQIPHGITSLLRIIAYMKYVDRAPRKDIFRIVKLGREILGWKELQTFEKSIALLAAGNVPTYRANLSEVDRLALETCHPAWFVDRLIRVFGRNIALNMLKRNLARLSSYVRLNKLAILNAEAEKGLAQKITGVKVHGVEGVWKIEKPSDILTGTNLVDSGTLVMQDLASTVASLVTAAKPTQAVLDLCAAPGNKTSHLAALMENRGEIYSIDISSSRLEHWKDQIKRTRVAIAEPIRADASELPIRRKHDVVLLDPPCSNTGVFAKNPSIKWRVTPAKVKDYATRQYRLLKAAADHVEVDGTLVYCTCSVLPEENEVVIENFLRRQQGFQLAPQVPFIGSPGLRGLAKCQRFYPHLHDCNGYFIAKLHRTD